jgi:hypothetical protein
MNIVHHKGLTLEHWFNFSVAEQLANVGCEIERTIRWRDKGNAEYSRLSFERALELMMLTKIDPKHSRGCRRELCRSYEALVDHFMCDNEYNTTDEQWQNYFYQFSYAAAIERQNRRAVKKAETG